MIKSLLFFLLSVGLLPKRTILVAHRGMLGSGRWGDGLIVILFEFLDDDTKLAQSCRNWLYVQHWHTVVPGARCPVCGVSLLSHASVVFVLCVLPTIPRLKKKKIWGREERWPQMVSTQGDFCPHACVHQPTVILRVPFTGRQVNAWICAR